MVVSGAAGATGSIVCQIGKRLGAKVIAIAGSPDKCAWLENEIGVDKALNYKSPNFRKEFIESVGFLDVYFDNVGGDILNLALTRLNMKARIVVCGTLCPNILFSRAPELTATESGAIADYSKLCRQAMLTAVH